MRARAAAAWPKQPWLANLWWWVLTMALSSVWSCLRSWHRPLVHEPMIRWYKHHLWNCSRGSACCSPAGAIGWAVAVWLGAEGVAGSGVTVGMAWGRDIPVAMPPGMGMGLIRLAIGRRSSFIAMQVV